MLSVLLAQTGGSGNDINVISQLTGSAGLGVGIWLFLRSDAERRDLQNKSASQMTALVEKCVGALTESTNTLKEVQAGMAQQVVQARTTAGPSIDTALERLERLARDLTAEPLPPTRPRRRGET